MIDMGPPVETSDPRPAIVPQGTRLPPPRPGVRHVTVVVLGIVIADDEPRPSYIN